VTALDHRATLRIGSAPAAPLVFTGADGFLGAELLETRTATAADARWADNLVAGLRPGERALVALSFEPEGPAVAHRIVPGAGLDAGPRALAPLSAGPAREHRVSERPSAAAYAGSVRAALGEIEAGRLEKVVLGRWLDVESSPALDPGQVVGRLAETRVGRYVFSVPLGPAPDAPLLLGASPELLVSRRGRLVASTPLAGSAPRSSDPAVDRARAEALQDSAKDLAEHAFVVEQIVRTLELVCTDVQAPAAPELLSTDALWHLATPIRARLAPGVGLSALHLAQLLQPTPAVGGVPTTTALATIAELEGTALDDGGRGPLTGAVGWVGPEGDGEFAVTIRAGVLDGERLRLFAGAGIVAGSDPDSEVRETAAKLSTMARAVGLEVEEVVR